jgi:hypothetical protein
MKKETTMEKTKSRIQELKTLSPLWGVAGGVGVSAGLPGWMAGWSGVSTGIDCSCFIIVRGFRVIPRAI